MPPRNRKLLPMATRPSKNSAKTRKKRYQIHTAIEPEYGESLDAYRAAQRYKPNLKDVIQDALRLFLAAEGFPVPTEQGNIGSGE